MLTLESLKGTHIAVATPCYGGQVFQNYLLSIIKLVYAAQKFDIQLSFIIRGGDSLIPRTRNSIVAEFMVSPQYTHLLWVDADIGFEPEAVFRLLAADRSVAAGIYPLKKIMWPDRIHKDMPMIEFKARAAKYPFNPIDGARVDEDGFIEVLDAPTGLMLIKRAVFEEMRDAYPDLKIVVDEMPGLEAIAAKVTEWNYRFFDVMTEASGRYLSEDYAFCRRWQNLGGKVVADIASNLTHQGTNVYEGNFHESFKAWAKPVVSSTDTAATSITNLLGSMKKP